MMAEPAAVAMAAFTADDPTDRAAFDEHMERVLANRGADHWAITDGDGTLVGTIATFPSDEGSPEITYWIAQPHWGQGHASRALALILGQTRRPVLAESRSTTSGRDACWRRVASTSWVATVTTPPAATPRPKNSSSGSVEDPPAGQATHRSGFRS
ncbi:MAG: GNAT family protein [Nocardioidaceae bacterium]